MGFLQTLYKQFVYTGDDTYSDGGYKKKEESEEPKIPMASIKDKLTSKFGDVTTISNCEEGLDILKRARVDIADPLKRMKLNRESAVREFGATRSKETITPYSENLFYEAIIKYIRRTTSVDLSDEHLKELIKNFFVDDLDEDEYTSEELNLIDILATYIGTLKNEETWIDIPLKDICDKLEQSPYMLSFIEVLDIKYNHKIMSELCNSSYILCGVTYSKHSLVAHSMARTNTVVSFDVNDTTFYVLREVQNVINSLVTTEQKLDYVKSKIKGSLYRQLLMQEVPMYQICLLFTLLSEFNEEQSDGKTVMEEKEDYVKKHEQILKEINKLVESSKHSTDTSEVLSVDNEDTSYKFDFDDFTEGDEFYEEDIEKYLLGESEFDESEQFSDANTDVEDLFKDLDVSSLLDEIDDEETDEMLCPTDKLTEQFIIEEYSTETPTVPEVVDYGKSLPKSNKSSLMQLEVQDDITPYTSCTSTAPDEDEFINCVDFDKLASEISASESDGTIAYVSASNENFDIGSEIGYTTVDPHYDKAAPIVPETSSVEAIVSEEPDTIEEPSINDAFDELDTLTIDDLEGLSMEDSFDDSLVADVFGNVGETNNVESTIVDNMNETPSEVEAFMNIEKDYITDHSMVLPDEEPLPETITPQADEVESVEDTNAEVVSKSPLLSGSSKIMYPSGDPELPTLFDDSVGLGEDYVNLNISELSIYTNMEYMDLTLRDLQVAVKRIENKVNLTGYHMTPDEQTIYEKIKVRKESWRDL